MAGASGSRFERWQERWQSGGRPKIGGTFFCICRPAALALRGDSPNSGFCHRSATARKEATEALGSGLSRGCETLRRAAALRFFPARSFFREQIHTLTQRGTVRETPSSGARRVAENLTSGAHILWIAGLDNHQRWWLTRSIGSQSAPMPERLSRTLFKQKPPVPEASVFLDLVRCADASFITLGSHRHRASRRLACDPPDRRRA